jgi:hypothetical protein
MDAKTYNGSELVAALKKGDLANSANVISGMVRTSVDEGTVDFSLTNGRQWIPIPVHMIKSAEQVFLKSEVSNPIVKITFAESKTAETKALLALLLASIENLSRYVGVDTQTALRRANNTGTGGTGYLCCKKAYPCGCYPNGELLICCDEWVPCSVIGSPSTSFIA